jgi:hypothetical protein
MFISEETLGKWISLHGLSFELTKCSCLLIKSSLQTSFLFVKDGYLRFIPVDVTFKASLREEKLIMPSKKPADLTNVDRCTSSCS